MSAPSQSTAHNRLLTRLSGADFARIVPHLKSVDLPRGQELIAPNQPIETVYFLETGICSIVTVNRAGQQMEVGIYGRDGMAGIPLLLGTDRTPHRHFIQVDATGFTMNARTFLALLDHCATLRATLLLFVQAFSLQVSTTAISNGSYKIEERLARWLLMCNDRLDTKHVGLTHQFLAVMLGVRRSGVTVALQMLETDKLVRSKRGRITVLDRAGLEQLAGTSYGVAEAEYRRLLGPL